MIDFNPKQVELLARIHGFKVKVKTNQYKIFKETAEKVGLKNYYVVNIYENLERCRDFEKFIRSEFDFDLRVTLFRYCDGWIARLKAKWGRID